VVTLQQLAAMVSKYHNAPTYLGCDTAITNFLLKIACDVTIITQQLNNPKPLLFKAENHASN
jgi:hypothetical protein